MSVNELGFVAGQKIVGSSCRKLGIEMDFLFVAVIVGFFALSVGLIRFCAGLMDKGGRS